MQTYLRSAILCGFLFVFVGCGGLESTVTGKVTLDDKALPTGTVSFHPKNAGIVAYGGIDAEGNYSVKTGSQKGLAAGEYVVTVMASTDPEPSTKPLKGQAMEPVGKLLVPDKYLAKQLSDLHFTVKPGRNQIDLQLRSQ